MTRYLLNTQEASTLLKSGEVVAFPTETVYGLGADATNSQAVAKIYEVKNRPSFNPLIVHVASLGKAEEQVVFNELAFKLAKKFWPGPLTLILPLKKDHLISSLVTAGLPTLGIRIPSHEIAQKLLKEVDLPIAAPSANRSSSISPTKAIHVEESLGTKISYILEGGSSKIGLESTIIDLSSDYPTLLRPGGISVEELHQILPNLHLHNNSNVINAPGQLKIHYAPSHPIRLNVSQVYENEALLAFGPNPIPTSGPYFNLSLKGDLVEAASNLFKMMHDIDKMDIKGIAIMPIPNHGLGLAINDRLLRAAA